MKHGILDTVVLDRDLPDPGLRRGDLGAVVQVHEPDGEEEDSDVRAVGGTDLIAVRPFNRST